MKQLRLNPLILLAIIWSCASPAFGQEDVRSRKITEYLKTDWEVRTETNEWQFTGKFIALPEQLQRELAASFPEHKFTIAEMNFCGHPPCDPHPLIVITDARDGGVVGFIRQLNWGRASKSFASLFNIYRASDKGDVEKRLVVLGKLIASTDERGNVGEVKRKKNIISVELIWAGGVWRRLEVKFDSKFQINRMSLIRAGNRGSFF